MRRRQTTLIPLAFCVAAVLLVAAPANAQLGGVTQPVVDGTGQLIGVVNEAGQVVDPDGNVIGIVEPVTGAVIDEGGNVIGQIGGGSGGGGNPGGGGGGAPGGSPDSPDQTQPGAPQSNFSFSFSMRGTQSHRSVRRRGMSMRTRCSSSCSVLAAIVIDSKTAKRLRLKSNAGAAIVGTFNSKSSGRKRMRYRSRARRQIDKYLPSTRRMRSVRRRELRARRASRSRNRTAAQRRRARSSARRLRRQRIRLGRRSIRVTMIAVGFDSQGRGSPLRTKRLRLKR